jgi:hypothetical protein
VHPELAVDDRRHDHGGAGASNAEGGTGTHGCDAVRQDVELLIRAIVSNAALETIQRVDPASERFAGLEIPVVPGFGVVEAPGFRAASSRVRDREPVDLEERARGLAFEAPEQGAAVVHEGQPPIGAGAQRDVGRIANLGVCRIQRVRPQVLRGTRQLRSAWTGLPPRRREFRVRRDVKAFLHSGSMARANAAN